MTETEYALKLSRKDLTPGTYTFVADNKGDAPHALSIKGPGVDSEETDTITSGRKARITVTLEQGTYQLWCPVGGHRSLGMELTLTVGEG